jgi:hypothetical protein
VGALRSDRERIAAWCRRAKDQNGSEFLKSKKAGDVLSEHEILTAAKWETLSLASKAAYRNANVPAFHHAACHRLNADNRATSLH